MNVLQLGVLVGQQRRPAEVVEQPDGDLVRARGLLAHMVHRVAQGAPQHDRDENASSAKMVTAIRYLKDIGWLSLREALQPQHMAPDIVVFLIPGRTKRVHAPPARILRPLAVNGQARIDRRRSTRSDSGTLEWAANTKLLTGSVSNSRRSLQLVVRVDLRKREARQPAGSRATDRHRLQAGRLGAVVLQGDVDARQQSGIEQGRP